MPKNAKEGLSQGSGDNPTNCETVRHTTNFSLGARVWRLGILRKLH